MKSGPSWNKARPCPHCEIPLNQVRYFHVELDECPTCLGLWFDRGELIKVRDVIDRELSWVAIDLLDYADKADFSPSSLDCPQCGSLMTSMRFSTSDIMVDFCINCHGLWLERGELQGIITHIWGSASHISLEDMGHATVEKFMDVFRGDKKFGQSVKGFLAAWNFLLLKLAESKPGLMRELDAIRRSFPF